MAEENKTNGTVNGIESGTVNMSKTYTSAAILFEKLGAEERQGITFVRI